MTCLLYTSGFVLDVLGDDVEAVNLCRQPRGDRRATAVAAFRAALEEMTRARVPLDWATSTGNQAVALRVLAERPLAAHGWEQNGCDRVVDSRCNKVERCV